jgi:hypothetical protein
MQHVAGHVAAHVAGHVAALKHGENMPAVQ